MASTTISSREFNQDSSGAKKAARKGPVFITDRGRPSHVLLTIADYQKLSGRSGTIVDLLSMLDADIVEFEPAKLSGDLFRVPDEL